MYKTPISTSIIALVCIPLCVESKECSLDEVPGGENWLPISPDKLPEPDEDPNKNFWHIVFTKAITNEDEIGEWFNEQRAEKDKNPGFQRPPQKITSSRGRKPRCKRWFNH